MELLAPVGSISALKAAVNAGANAVYLGLGELNARIKSDDFNTSNLQKWVEYAHFFGVKVHVTLNTAVKDGELLRAFELAKCAVKSGADALIVSDLGLLAVLLRSTNIPIHLSTQAGVQNYLDARFAAKLGVKRVILARETLFSDVANVQKEVDEVECFIQGAMCVCFSGGCLFGSVQYGCSGNRGVCNQPCRMKYSAYDSKGNLLKSGYLLSPYDLCVGEDVLRLREIGVNSVKIEGRLKRPAYVYGAVSYYRSLLDGKDASNARLDMEKAFNRGFVKGYSIRKSDSVIHTSVPTHVGVFVGKIDKTFEKNGYRYAYIASSYRFNKGDGAKILRGGTEVGGSDVTSVREEGKYQIIPVSKDAMVGDEIHLTTDALQVSAAENIENRRPIRLTISGEVGKPMLLTGQCGETKITVQSQTLLQKGKEGAREAIQSKLSKFGSSDFFLGEYEDKLPSPAFLPVSELNAMRRELATLLFGAVVKKNTPEYRISEDFSHSSLKEKQRASAKILVEIANAEDVTAAKCADAYVLNADAFTEEQIEKILSMADGAPCYLRLPKIAREADLKSIQKTLSAFANIGIFADNLYAVQLARESKHPYIAGFGLNIFNTESAALFFDADLVCASIEEPTCGDVVFAGGKIPLMSFAHCPVSVAYSRRCEQCDKSVDYLTYKNMDNSYLIRRNEWGGCHFTMYQDKLTLREVPKGKCAFFGLVALSAAERACALAAIKEAKGV